MALFNSFTFDGENSLTYGVYISGEGVFNAPERATERISIPGRNGDLIVDYGRYENIEVTYPAGIYGDDEADFADKVRQFRNILSSRYTYKRLIDSYHTDEFRLAVFKNGFTISPVQKTKAGEFSIVFDCKPQRFLTSGEAAQVFTASSSITNPTAFPSDPLIAITGPGTVSIGDITITSAASSGDVVYIDCDTKEIYQIVSQLPVNASSLISFSGTEFPYLPAGASTLTLTDVTSVSITPRWWRL